ncbi:homeobox protein HD1-like [Andrographis paniculata]|uniref:homeobox protein HD1-like n=1 Tax=Andrographis paniculata TaxID=175694 RepID=UPI0021E84410|nr:homeobox protein HD1-like [Andrographis paniculata]XP_051137711.1 homeobox protein HD1-like [Andrographis paniculata]
MMEMGSGGGLSDMTTAVSGEQHHQLKVEIANHPLYPQLLSAHVACLRVATPIDQLSSIDDQLSQSQNILRSYAQNTSNYIPLSPQERQELDNFLTQYFMVLWSFKEQLQQHVRVHAVEAVMACREIEQNLHSLTGATFGEGTGATMSDDEDDLQMDFSLDQSGGEGNDLMGFGPLLPTESERTLMERVRQELKIELKQGFKSRIEDVREEILRKRRAGKLPGNTTCVLKNWWQQHSKWPYPTEDDKAKLVEQTGLQLKQINNWFINQRKRNWHSNSQSAKSKRKR